MSLPTCRRCSTRRPQHVSAPLERRQAPVVCHVRTLEFISRPRRSGSSSARAASAPRALASGCGDHQRWLQRAATPASHHSSERWDKAPCAACSRLLQLLQVERFSGLPPTEDVTFPGLPKMGRDSVHTESRTPGELLLAWLQLSAKGGPCRAPQATRWADETVVFL